MESAIQTFSNAPTQVQNNKHRVWTCEICNNSMGEMFQQSHLAGKKHNARVQRIGQQSNDQNPSSIKGSLREAESSKTKVPLEEEITDPVTLSYLRMKQQMELYSDLAKKTSNSKTLAEAKEDSAHETQAVHSETVLQGKEGEGDENDNSTITDISFKKQSTLQLLKSMATPSTPAMVSLRAAQGIQDFKNLNYPAEILSPGLVQHSTGDFKYNKDFLMQFENVFTEKPFANWDRRVYGLFGDEAPLTKASRATLGLDAVGPSITKKARGSSRSGQPLSTMTPMQRFELSKPARQPETKTDGTHTGVDITQKSPESSLKGSEPKKPRSGNRSSRGSRKNKETSVDGTEPEQRDNPKEIPPTADFANLSKNDSSEREVVPIPDNPPYTAHIGNLNFEIEAQEISDFFWECDVKTVRLVRDKLNDHPKGFGYVEFNTKDGLIAATELNGVKILGRNIRINIARPPKATKVERPTSGGWRRDAASAHSGPSLDTPIIGLSAVVRALEESEGSWRPTLVEKSPVDRNEKWRNTTPQKKEPSKEQAPKWDCESCGISVALDKKETHLGGLRHAAKLKKQQQQSAGGNSNVRKDGRRRPSVIRGQTPEEGNIDNWGGNPSDGTFSNCDWES